jgi:DNA-binding IclR family transcriptional regulator
MASRGQAGRTKASSAPRETLSAVRHAVDVLRCLSEVNSPIGVNEIARRIGLHKSTVSRLAGALEDERLLQRDASTGRFSLGIGLVALAAPVLAGFEVRDLARPLLELLARQTGETVSFNIWNGTEAVSIEQVPGSNSVRAFSRPGHRDPGHGTASGKILLAHLGQKAITVYCSRPLQRFTDRTITDPTVLISALELYRAQGFATNLGELESDVGAVAAVVFDRASNVVGAVSAAVPMYRFTPARRSELADSVRRCAAELSANLGYPTSLQRLSSDPGNR